MKLGLNNISIESSDTKKISDGNHTFEELYEHRHHLFLLLMKCKPQVSWISKQHHDDTPMFDDMFIGGMTLPSGQITYHLPLRLWNKAVNTKAKILKKGMEWDGHSSFDVIQRINEAI